MLTLALSSPATPRLRELVLPREHGSWSFVLEPLALGLLAAPSRPGAGFAIGVIALFLARRPLQLATASEATPRRDAARSVLLMLGTIAFVAFLAALHDAARDAWCVLAAAVLPASAFAHFERAGETRACAAELAAVTACASLPAVLLLLAGHSLAAALALSALMLVRSIPTVLTLRAVLRGRRKQAVSLHLPRIAALLGIAGIIVLERSYLLPTISVGAVALLALRTAWWLSSAAPSWRAARLGMFEAALGAVFVIAIGCAL